MVKTTISDKFNHLLKILSSERFLKKQILFNDVPFFIADYDVKLQDEIVDMQEKLIKQLAVKGIKVLEINLYDLVVSILKENGDWDWYIENESTMKKEELKEEFQSILDIENVITPAIAKRLQEDCDILFITGIGEVFPYIRSHTVLSNLQKTAKDMPVLMFFPGEYKYIQNIGTSFSLFSKFPEDREYRAKNIYEIKEV